MAKIEKELFSLARGEEVIRAALEKLSGAPGVYRMLGAKDEVLYVGKAKSLKKRVLAYANAGRLPVRLQRMVAQTARMEFTQTHTEAEALLLEANLIKALKPYFNVLLRDDKSFPYILMTADHDFPTILKHRGARRRKGEYFGPFAGAGDVNRVIEMLQRAFMLRNCSDNYFAARKRPCLQYHIKRCAAPCVGLVSEKDYAAQTAEARAFLKGNSREVQERMRKEMDKASAAMDYERAAAFRDRIRALTSIQARQDIHIKGIRDADIFALAAAGGKTCVQVIFFRGGQNYGNRAYFPRHHAEEKPETVLAAFIAQFYQSRHAAREIIVSHELAERKLIEEALSMKASAVRITRPARGARKRLLSFALRNAAAALERHMAESAGAQEILAKVAALLKLETPPRRIEVFDNSHISGTNMVGAMIVAGPEGFRKSAYRKFNIKNSAASDDYAMMREVMSRRFGRALKESGSDWPDLVVIDGGAGQLGAAAEVLEALNVLDTLTVIAISKGPDRNAGREKFHLREKTFDLDAHDPVLHYFQRLRDEAHRFAISAHRARRAKQIVTSALDEVPGIGARRKKALLNHFGSAKAVMDAGIDDLARVDGVSREAAKRIYDFFH